MKNDENTPGHPEFNGPVMYRTCANCQESKPINLFYKNNKAPNGRTTFCAACGKAKASEWRVTHADSHRASARKGYHKDPDKARSRTQLRRSVATAEDKARARDLHRAGRVRGGVAYREAAAARAREWRVLNPERARAQDIRKRVRRAAAGWANEVEIAKFYEEAKRRSAAEGGGFVVDHLYPIAGKTVCGLHVENNLKVVHRRNNQKKYNYMPGELAHELWDPAGPDVFHESTHE